MDIKFNVYYATDKDGPWTLANDTPIDKEELGNSYQISGLNTQTVYYVAVVGGVIEDGEFVPRIPQVVGLQSKGADDISNTYAATASVRTFGPNLEDESTLGHQLRMIGFGGESILAHTFAMQADDLSTLGHKFAVAVTDEGLVGHRFQILADQPDVWIVTVIYDSMGDTFPSGPYWTTDWQLEESDTTRRAKQGIITELDVKLLPHGVAMNASYPRKIVAMGEWADTFAGTNNGGLIWCDRSTGDWNGIGDIWSPIVKGSNIVPDAEGAGFSYPLCLAHNHLPDGSGGLYVAGSYHGRVWYSSDGENWSASSGLQGGLTANTHCQDVVYFPDASRWTIVGDEDSTYGNIYTSLNGIDFTNIPITGAPTGNSPIISCIAVGELSGSPVLLAGGKDMSGVFQMRITYSYDGQAWNDLATLPPSNGWYGVEAVTYDPTRQAWFVCFGKNANDGYIAWSTDLVNWTEYYVDDDGGDNVRPSAITHDGNGTIAAIGYKGFLYLMRPGETTFTRIEHALGDFGGTFVQCRDIMHTNVPK